MFEFNCGNSNDGIQMIRIQFAPGVTEYKAGTPFSREGRFSNDGNAYGLLKQDIRLPVGGKVPVVTEGTVNTDELARHCGVVLSEEAKAAMSGITFLRDGGTPPTQELIVNATADTWQWNGQGGEMPVTIDKTYSEIMAAVRAGANVRMMMDAGGVTDIVLPYSAHNDAACFGGVVALAIPGSSPMVTVYVNEDNTCQGWVFVFPFY